MIKLTQALIEFFSQVLKPFLDYIDHYRSKRLLIYISVLSVVAADWYYDIGIETKVYLYLFLLAMITITGMSLEEMVARYGETRSSKLQSNQIEEAEAGLGKSV